MLAPLDVARPLPVASYPYETRQAEETAAALTRAYEGAPLVVEALCPGCGSAYGVLVAACDDCGGSGWVPTLFARLWLTDRKRGNGRRRVWRCRRRRCAECYGGGLVSLDCAACNGGEIEHTREARLHPADAYALERSDAA